MNLNGSVDLRSEMQKGLGGGGDKGMYLRLRAR